MKRKKVIVIGSGFAGISAATHLAAGGFDVTILEKNDQPGGRARKLNAAGFTFDMGPSWYWMPDVFESYFNTFGRSAADYYELIRLSPSYQVFFKDGSAVHIPSSLNELYDLFESIELGSAKKLKQFLTEAEYKYDVGIKSLVYKPGLSALEYLDKRVLFGAFKLDLLGSFHNYIRNYFKNEKLLQLLEFPILFLGAQPKNIPALYSLMNYADMALGTWYPAGGMTMVVEAMLQLANEKGVSLKLNEEVIKINVSKKQATCVVTNRATYEADVVVGGADYHHIEQCLLKDSERSYSESYWNSRVLAPSCLIYYVGINKRLPGLQHHNLFFDKDFDVHASEIYETKKWPSVPLFYVCAPSFTDPTVAPEGYENLFILIPVAPGLKDTPEIRERYFNEAIARIESKTKEDNLKQHVVYRKDFAPLNFMADYNSFKGNAYGLANTLKQTAFLKPSIKSKKVKNLYYTGQLTVPGPGVPPSLISGAVVAKQIINDLKN